jgi:pyrimidine deaminase RibD-like protein
MNNEERAARRSEIECGVTPKPTPLRPPPLRLPKGCEAPAVVPKQIFFVPRAEAENINQPPPRPSGVLVENNQFSINCADVDGLGPIGSTVVVNRGTFVDYFYFQSIDGINESQLRYIESLSDAVRNGVMGPVDLALLSPESQRANLLEAAAVNISNLVIIPLETARLVVAALVDIKNRLNELAKQAGRSALDCYWVNEEVTVQCPPGALTTPGVVGMPVTNPAVIPAGTYRSYSSQADANSIAQVAANGLLVCIWGNVETTKTCQDLNPSFTEPVPVENAPIGVMEKPRVGTVVIPANTIFSNISQEDANNQAADLALQRLECYYTNDVLTVTCADFGVIPSIGNYLSSQPGSTIIVPAGSVMSLVSTADANNLATAAANQLLQCVWTNTEQTVDCLSILPTRPPEGEGPSETKSPVYSYTVPAGTVTSDVSQADADETARQLGRVQLDCVYCNKAIPATCVPLPNGDVSIDQTEAVAAGTFCARTFEEAQALAASIASIPINVKSTPESEQGLGCRYGNSEIRVKCFGLASDDGTQPDAYGIVGIKKFTVPEMPKSTLLTPNNTQDGHVIISKNTFILSLAEIPIANRDNPQAYVDNFAKNLAMSMLNCIFGNNQQIDNSPCPAGFTKVQDGFVAENSIQSLISQEDADAQASALAASLKICINNNFIGGSNARGVSSSARPTCFTNPNTIIGYIQSAFSFPPRPDSGSVVSFANGAAYQIFKSSTAGPYNPPYLLNVVIQGALYRAVAVELPCEENLHPFKVLTRFNNNSMRVGVYYHSDLYRSLGPNDKQTITGLLTAHPPSQNDSGWFTPSSNDLIWLEVNFNPNGGNPTSARIRSLSTGGQFDINLGAWGGSDAYVVHNENNIEPKQIKCRKLIARVNNGNIKQIMVGHQVLRLTCINGYRAMYPFTY